MTESALAGILIVIICIAWLLYSLSLRPRKTKTKFATYLITHIVIEGQRIKLTPPMSVTVDEKIRLFFEGSSTSEVTVANIKAGKWITKEVSK